MALALGLAVAAATAGAVPARAGDGAGETAKVPFSTLMRSPAGGGPERVEYSRGSVTVEGVWADGHRAAARAPFNEGWIMEAAKAGVDVTVAEDPPATFWGKAWGFLGMAFAILVPLFLVTCMGALVWFTVRGPGLGRGAGREAGGGDRKATFADVAGAEEAKRDLMETVDFLKNPARFQALGARVPRGILLVGDPGNGKTLLARAVAGEAGVPFHHCSGSDFVEMYVGLGARRVRRLFGKAGAPPGGRGLRRFLRRKAPVGPAILFIDEIDAVGRRRGAGDGGGADREHDQTLNALLTEMDGLAGGTGVVIIAATNRVEVLDPALLRSGRFDRHVTVPAPRVDAREDILRVHVRKLPLDPDVDLGAVARGTVGFSGADLEALANEAAVEAARDGAATVAARHFEAARDRKLLGGAERRGVALLPEETETVCYHEAGHALAAILTPESDPVHKATVVPRGGALGFVARLPDAERVLYRRSRMEAMLVVAMAGRAAEEERFGNAGVTGGCASDIAYATQVARDMVARHGLGDGLSSRVAGAFPLSEGTLRAVDEEVEATVRRAYGTARAMMAARRDALDALAAALRERETLDGGVLRGIVEAHPGIPAPTDVVALAEAA